MNAIILALVINIAAVTSVKATPLYTIQDLGALWAEQHPGATHAVNAFGEVIGTRSNRPFLYSNGITVDLDNSGSAKDINDKHQVVGVSHDNRGFLYNNGTLIDIGDLGYGGDVVAQAINNSEQIVGDAFDGNNSRAFRWSSGTMIGLPVGGGFSSAYGINNLGEIVGIANNRAFLYSASQITDLGTLGGTTSIARRINDSQMIVGDAFLPGNSLRHAVLYDHGAIIDLTPGLQRETYAYGINNLGQIVGNVASSDQPQYAFVIDNGVMIDLNALIQPDNNWYLTNAEDINELGEIAGAGFYQGNFHGFLLSPFRSVTEPATLNLLFFTLFILPFVCQYKRGRLHRAAVG